VRKELEMQLTWEDVVNRDDFIGGELEIADGGEVFRGPISSIEIKEDGLVYIRSPWVARKDPDSGEWNKWPNGPVMLNPKFISPHDIGSGRIFFTMPSLGQGTIFPKGGSKLDPSKVKGLTDADLAAANA